MLFSSYLFLGLLRDHSLLHFGRQSFKTWEQNIEIFAGKRLWSFAVKNNLKVCYQRGLGVCGPLSGRHPQTWLLCLGSCFRIHPHPLLLGPWPPWLMGAGLAASGQSCVGVQITISKTQIDLRVRLPLLLTFTQVPREHGSGLTINLASSCHLKFLRSWGCCLMINRNLRAWLPFIHCSQTLSACSELSVSLGAREF